MDLDHDTFLAEGLLASAWARLQHLQLVLASKWWDDRGWDGFWGAVKACTLLTGLQLVFKPESGEAIDQLVATFTLLRQLLCCDCKAGCRWQH